jgi:hypothetical protein
MKSLFTTTALSAFLLTGVAFAQDEAEKAADQTTDVEEFVEEEANEPITVGDLEEDELDGVEDAETLNAVVLEATTQKGDGEIRTASNISEDRDGERQQTTADASTTPDTPDQEDLTEEQRRQQVAINRLLGEDPETQTAEADEDDAPDNNDVTVASSGTDMSDDMDEDEQETEMASATTTSDTSYEPQDDDEDTVTTAGLDTDIDADNEYEPETEADLEMDATGTTMASADADLQSDREYDLEDDQDEQDYAESDRMDTDRMGMEPTTVAAIQRYDEGQLAPTERMATVLLDADVEGADDNDVAEIEDFIVDRDGRIAEAVIRAGGILGLGKKTYTVGFDQLTMMEEDDDEVEIATTLTKDSVKQLTPWSREEFAIGEGGNTLISELADAELALMGSDETAEVQDVIVSDDGRVEGVILAFEGEDYRVGYDRISVAEGDAEGSSGYRLDASREDFMNSTSATTGVGTTSTMDPATSPDPMDNGGEPYGPEQYDEQDQMEGEDPLAPANQYDEDYDSAYETEEPIEPLDSNVGEDPMMPMDNNMDDSDTPIVDDPAQDAGELEVEADDEMDIEDDAEAAAETAPDEEPGR